MQSDLCKSWDKKKFKGSGPSCKKAASAMEKSTFPSRKVPLSDHDFSKALPLCNRFELLGEVDSDMLYANANAKDTTPCHAVDQSSKISDRSVPSNNTRDIIPDLLRRK